MTDSTPLSPASCASPAELVERLAAEMAAAWRQSERTPAETYFDRHPELYDYPEEAVRLVYEEVCLSQELGQHVTAEELTLRFPLWAEELSILLDCHQLMQSRLAPPVFPSVNESLGDFRLIAQLGQGSQGRVFLATQPSLADRPVVLKVTPRRAREHLSLAHLQHTHIIPLHAMYDFPARGLRAMCMPFLGGASLAQILDLLYDTSLSRRTGQSILDALEQLECAAPIRLAGHSGFRRLLAGVSYVEAICHLGACLADGLQYAHERGLVHLDLKPSNVLLAADAQPLLLDFHLAHQPLRAGRPAPEWFGGTPEFMPPEQAEACAAARLGRPLPVGVDERADIYSLGRLLYVALAGADAQQPLPSLRRVNPQVSVGLADIVHKCLAAKPEDRYPSAAALAADLRRHLAHLPLQGVPNRNWRERWHKWRRRRPNAPLWMGLLLALAGAGAILVAGGLERYHDAQTALLEGRGQMQRGAHREAMRTLSRGITRALGLPGGAGLAQTLDLELALARRAQAAQDFHAVAESLRFLAGAEVHSLRDLQKLDVHCRTAWEARGLIADPEVTKLDLDKEEQLRADLLDIALLWTELTRKLPGQRDTRAGRQRIETILAEAEALLGPCAALARERLLLESKSVTENALAPAARQGSWEHVVLGQSLLRAGELERAAQELERAVDLRPHDFWANFYRGVCAYRRNKYAESVQSFSVAVALAPASPECYYNRALAHAAWGESDRALRDYDRALELSPHLGAAALNRGVLHYQKERYLQAKEDLTRALRDGAEPAAVHYNLALVYHAERDQAAALRHVEQALQHEPGHAGAKSLRERLRKGS